MFEEHGVEANGYGWTGVARQAIQAGAPELGAKIQFDPEAGMFAARSASRPALERLAMLLRRAYDDPAVLSQLVVDADPAWLD